MQRLKAIHYKIIDDWGDMAVDSILERHNDESKLLWVFGNGNKKEVELTGREDELIEELLECDILSWDGKTFGFPYEDGDTWHLDIAFDDKHVHCNGYSYPKNFFKFITAVGLHNGDDKEEEEYINTSSKYDEVYDLKYEECGYESYCDIDLEDILDYEYDKLRKIIKKEITEKTVYLTKALYRLHAPYFYDEEVELDLKNKRISYELLDRGMVPDAIIKSGKNGFKPVSCQRENHKEKVVYSKGKTISDYDFEQLLPLCMAKDFEKYRYADICKDISGYYDEGAFVTFEAYSDSFYPYIKWDNIGCFHSGDKMWPHEKILEYIFSNILERKYSKEVV